MVYEYTSDEISQQIVRLLDYPRVGPLDEAAIAVNLGTTPDVIDGPLQSCLADGRLVRLPDGRITAPLSRGEQ